MNACPNCNEPVLAMAKSCRHCGEVIDEATFFLDEAGVAADIAAYQKELEVKKKLADGLSKKFKLAAIAAVLCFLVGGGLVAFAEYYVRGLGAVLTLSGVGATFFALKMRQELVSLEKPED